MWLLLIFICIHCLCTLSIQILSSTIDKLFV